jgi:hypothetical protein
MWRLWHWARLKGAVAVLVGRQTSKSTVLKQAVVALDYSSSLALCKGLGSKAPVKFRMSALHTDTTC